MTHAHDNIVNNYMTPHPYTIGADQTLEDAKHVMYAKTIRHLPVLEGGRLIGILSDRDVKLAFAVDGSRAKECKVIDACSTDIYSAETTESLKTVTLTMAKRAIGCCIVTDKGKTVGIFTATDACQVLGETLV